MRLLMTTDTVGGVWTFTKELATALLERGCAVSLVSFGRLPSPDQQRAMLALSKAFPQTFRYEPSPEPLEWMENNADSYASAARLLMATVHAWLPDLILSSQFCFGALPVSPPKIVIAHSDVLSWAQACGKAPLPRDAWLSTYLSLVQAGLSGAEAVIAPTRWMLSALQSNFVLPTLRAVIRNGRTFEAQPTAVEKTMQAVSAGRFWDQAKNLNLLKSMDTPVPIVVAGDAGQTPPIADGIRYAGVQSEAELLRLFSASALYLCTSVYEPFGLAPVEAALCGCAVLANDIPSLNEVWGQAALYFRDAASLSGLLRRLSSDPALLREAQRRSQEHAEGFSRDRMGVHYLHFMERVLQSRTEHTAHAA